MLNVFVNKKKFLKVFNPDFPTNHLRIGKSSNESEWKVNLLITIMTKAHSAKKSRKNHENYIIQSLRFETDNAKKKYFSSRFGSELHNSKIRTENSAEWNVNKIQFHFRTQHFDHGSYFRSCFDFSWLHQVRIFPSATWFIFSLKNSPIGDATNILTVYRVRWIFLLFDFVRAVVMDKRLKWITEIIMVGYCFASSLVVYSFALLSN